MRIGIENGANSATLSTQFGDSAFLYADPWRQAIDFGAAQKCTVTELHRQR